MNGKYKTFASSFKTSEPGMLYFAKIAKKLKSPLSLLLSGVLLFSTHVSADLYYNDDVIVHGSLCVGVDCNSGENFTFDTIRMRENNLRIKFIDSSNAAGFPTRDWELTANESANGGVDYFAIQDITNETIPFKVIGAVSTDAVYIAPRGVGFGTSTPTVELHAKAGNSPTLRLEQDGSSGFAARTWDVGGNETNFFVRDVDNNASLPLRIAAGATSAAIFIAADGDVGFETTSPDGMFDIAHPSNINDHAVLVDASANFGINIANSFIPRGLLDIQAGNGSSVFMVRSDGKVGVGMGASDLPAGLIEAKIGGASKFIVDNQGDVGIGTATPVGRFEVTNTAGTTSYFGVDATGNVGVGTNTPTAEFDITSSGANMLLRDSEVPATKELRTLLKLQSHWGNQVHFVADGSTLNNEFYLGTSKSGNSFLLTQYTNSAESHKFNFTNGQLIIVSGATTTLNFDGNNMTINGAVVQTSSRTSKDNIVGVDEGDILNKLSNLAIKKWNYIADGEGIKHIGPIAEDFYSLFGLGVDEKHITTIDLSGVAIAGIQALNTESKEKDAKLQQELESLKLENKMMSDKLSQIETKLQNLLEIEK